ncbi:MAG: hypothetical protein Q8N60_01450, partial [Candidatus Diapherotrites archaeon]|nr:hypothetical protein [Candidatus Diapherotrites archaeon]
TLSSEAVWQKTHVMGSHTFKVNAFVILLALFFVDYFVWIAFAPIIANALFLSAYSYLEFRKETALKRKKKK